MDIRKTDSKGRVSIGKKGTNYFTSVYPDGSVTLTPVPESSEVPSKGMRIFNRPMGAGKTTELVKMLLATGNEDVYYVAPTRSQADNAYKIALQVFMGVNGGSVHPVITNPDIRKRFISAATLSEMPKGTRYVVDEVDGVLDFLIQGYVLAIAGTDGKMKADQIHALQNREPKIGAFDEKARQQIVDAIKRANGDPL